MPILSLHRMGYRVLTKQTRWTTFLARSSIRTFHFATGEYTACFHDLPTVDTSLLRDQAKEYLESFDRQIWYDDPVSVKGVPFCYSC